MTSNLECVGLAMPDRAAMQELVVSALDAAEVLGRRGALVVHRWQDPSGARLVVCTEGAEIVDVLPSFAAEPGARLAAVRAVNDDVAFADVHDDGGELVTRLAAEFEQRRLLPAGPVAGRASIVALGMEATVHASAEDFAASAASLLGSEREDDEPPAHFAANNWPWPPRMAAESFISYGVFNSGETAEAYARLNGVVLAADVRTVAATGQRFIAARVRCAGFEASVCLPADARTAPPQPGSVVAGVMLLTASLPDLAVRPDEPARRFRLPWKR